MVLLNYLLQQAHADAPNIDIILYCVRRNECGQWNWQRFGFLRAPTKFDWQCGLVARNIIIARTVVNSNGYRSSNFIITIIDEV